MPLFALTLFVAAALLFVVQPMIAKGLLPALGGSPGVWNTCAAFFQATLLAGYAYAHAATARLRVRGQVVLHLVLLGLILVAWPAAPTLANEPTGHPIAWLLGTLARSIGLPFLAVAATAPLLQHWFARTGHREARDPYFLYGASNLGSLLALLAYPTLIEANLPLGSQGRLWSLGFGVLTALVAACAWATWRATGEDRAEGPSIRLDLRSIAAWIALAAIPSSLMLGVTTYLSTDIAAIPLLWVVPLAIYLATFIVAFARRPIVPHRVACRALPWAVMALTPALASGLVQWFWMPIHLLTFALAGLVCHGELVRRRPPAEALTAFYLAIAAGGMLGGTFNALVAPLVFDRLAEYPIALVLACLALPTLGKPRFEVRGAALPLVIFLVMAALILNPRGWADSTAAVPAIMLASGLVALACWSHRRRPRRFALAIGAVLLASGLWPGRGGRVLDRDRNFFGVVRVTLDEVPDPATGRVERFHRLFHGNTLHGQQSLEPARRREPLAFFTRSGPIGQVFEARGLRGDLAVAGLGVGTLAAYARPGQRWTFFEIDPAVVRIGRDPRYFTYLADCRADALTIVEGDARLRLRAAADRSFALIVLDAFSSDAVPVHLLTREAFRLYRAKLLDGGRIAFNLSNRYLDLEPVVGALARDAAWTCRVREDLDVTRDQRRAGKEPSIWAVVAAHESDLGPIARDPRWRPARAHPGDRPWTDDASDLASHFLFRARRVRPRS